MTFYTFQASALLTNVFTLIVGIMFVLTDFLEKQAIAAGETFDSLQRDAISVVIFVANLLVVGLPIIRGLAKTGIPSIVVMTLTSCLAIIKARIKYGGKQDVSVQTLPYGTRVVIRREKVISSFFNPSSKHDRESN